MSPLRLFIIWIILTASAAAQSSELACWLGEITEDSLSQPGLFGKIAGVIAGRANDQRMAYPFGVQVEADQYFVLSRQTNDIVLVNRRSHQTRVLGTGKAGLITPVTAIGGPDRYFLSDPDQSSVFMGRGDKLKPFVGPERGLLRPTGLAWDRERGRVWIVDTGRHKALCYSLDAELLFELGGRGDEEDALNYPTFIALCHDGAVIINDTMNGRIKKWNVDGQFVWSSGDLLTAEDPLGRAKGIAVDQHDRVFVVDNLEDRVMVFSPEGDLLGSFGSSGSGAGELWSPVGIAVAGDTVIVADTQNHRLALFTLAGEGGR